MPIEPVGQVGEGQTALWVGPRQLTAGSVVPERAGAVAVPKTSTRTEAVAAGDDEPDRAVRVDAAGQRVLERVAHVAGSDGQPLRVPQLTGVVQQRLIEA